MAKIIKVTSEGYSGIDKIFPAGEHYYYFESEQEAGRFYAEFEVWREKLGECKDAIYIDHHSASSHVYLEVIDPEELPEMFR